MRELSTMRSQRRAIDGDPAGHAERLLRMAGRVCDRPITPMPNHPDERGDRRYRTGSGRSLQRPPAVLAFPANEWPQRGYSAQALGMWYDIHEFGCHPGHVD